MKVGWNDLVGQPDLASRSTDDDGGVYLPYLRVDYASSIISPTLKVFFIPKKRVGDSQK